MSPDAQPLPQAVILAAGKGTRMGSDKPKVLFEVAGEPMVRWVVRACREAGVTRCIIVVGYRGQDVRDALANEPGCAYVEQKEQLGTGHAARMAEGLFSPDKPVDLFVLAGDGPLIRAETLKKLLAVHRQRGAAATLASALLDDPTGYGRVLREADGSFKTIVEQKDSTPEQLLVREVNPSYYCFRSDLLFSALGRVRNDNKQGEYYLTDVPALLKAQGKTAAVIDAVPPEDVLSINTPEQLAEVDRILRKRLAASSAHPSAGKATR
ncbi:MAG: NTP transferase domain-containing protein [Planctomycetota bacterium]|nr:NTP transferase domain-containing protein [Planctomycetota bacterium]